jgi:hypothetical protein
MKDKPMKKENHGMKKDKDINGGDKFENRLMNEKSACMDF